MSGDQVFTEEEIEVAYILLSLKDASQKEAKKRGLKTAAAPQGAKEASPSPLATSPAAARAGVALGRH